MVFFGNQQIWLRLNPTLQLYYNAIPMLIFRDSTRREFNKKMIDYVLIIIIILNLNLCFSI